MEPEGQQGEWDDEVLPRYHRGVAVQALGQGACPHRLCHLHRVRLLGGDGTAGGAREEEAQQIRLLLGGVLQHRGEVLHGVPIQN